MGRGERSVYRLIDIDLARPVPDVALTPDETGIGVVAWLRGRPVAFVLAPHPAGLVRGAEIDRLVGRADAVGIVRTALAEELAAGRAPAQASVPLTVAVCTKDGGERLAACLDSLVVAARVAHDEAASGAGESAPIELLVVDNASSDDGTRRVAERYPQVRYATEPAAGLDFARNRAVAEATGDVLAFVDDDVEVDRNYLVGLRRAWAEHPDAGCVTGLVLPFELATEAQVRFEQRGGFRRGFEQLRYHGPTLAGNPLYPFGAGMFGAGCNMSFRRSLVVELGGFDEALDTGRPLPGGGDIDMFFQVVRAGWPLVYEPGAVVRHKHRREHEVLRRQYYTWGTGFMAFVTKWRALVAREDRATIDRLLRWWFLRYQPGMLARGLLGRKGMTADLALAEVVGGVVGLAGEYRRSQRRVARIARAARGGAPGPVAALAAAHADGPAPGPAPPPAPEPEAGGVRAALPHPGPEPGPGRVAQGVPEPPGGARAGGDAGIASASEAAAP
jgi:GT2 family glycosyltransferase